MTFGEDLQEFGRGFMRICETLGEDLQGFVRLWENIFQFANENFSFIILE